MKHFVLANKIGSSVQKSLALVTLIDIAFSTH